MNIQELKAASEKRAAEEKAMRQSQEVDTKPEEEISIDEILEALKNNQDGDANLFSRCQKKKLVFDHTENQWFIWKNEHWKIDTTAEALNLVKELIDLYRKAISELRQDISAKLSDGLDQEALVSIRLEKMLRFRINDLQTLKRKKSILTLASAGRENLGVSGEDWDCNPWLLGCANGVIELKTGSFRNAKPEDFISIISPVEWQGLNAPAPRWEQYLLEIFDNNQELVNFLQRLMGYALSGQVSEHIFPIFWGQGRNGKGTLIETISRILDKLSGPIPTETLMKQQLIASGAAPSPDIMALKGRRIAWASETSENGKLNIEKIKRFVGGDTLVARAPYGKHMVTFNPTHTLFLLTNHKPQIQDNEYAFWNRVAQRQLFLKPTTIKLVH